MELRTRRTVEESDLLRRRAGVPLAIGLVVFSLLAVVVHDSVRLVGQTFPGFLTWDNGILVAFHDETWSGARAGLPVNGGRVVAMDGEPLESGRQLLDTAAALPRGALISYRVAMAGDEEEIIVPTMRLSAASYVGTFGIYLGVAAVFFVIALVALYLRPDRAEARALAVLMLMVGLLMTLAVDYLSSFRFVRLCQLVEAAIPAAVVFFAIVFPVERVPRSRRRRIVPGLFAMFLVLGFVNMALFYQRPEQARAITNLIYLLIATAMIGLLVSLAYTVMRAETPADRMRAAVVFSGGLVSSLLPAIAIPAFLLVGWTFSFSWIFGFLVFFPISVLYAVVRYDLLGAERFIRLSLGYSVATSAVVLVYVATLFLIEQTVSPAASSSPAAALLFLVTLALIFEPARRRVQTTVDRVFFRSAVDAGRVLEESGTELADLGDEAEIISYVEQRLADALSLEWVQLVSGGQAVPPGEIREPVDFRQQGLGLVVCGPKRSGAPFSAAERELVKGMAAQAALALHNARSVQELKKAQEALIRSERLAAIGELAGSVAHGIRNPLSGIRAAAQIAREQAREPDLQETLDSVLQESDRLEQRVRTLLDFSRPFDPNPRPTDVGALLEAVRSTVARQADGQGVALSAEVSGEPCSVETDPDFLEEAILELAGNALRAMPNGGELRLRASRGDGRTEIVVSDTGGGIPPGVQGRIFDLFFTTRPTGTGMGLATVKKIIERLGGVVALESSNQGGTRFRIDLP
jgi:signal transduction histidine kinase